jgi:hypothetical protein
MGHGLEPRALGKRGAKLSLAARDLARLNRPRESYTLQVSTFLVWYSIWPAPVRFRRGSKSDYEPPVLFTKPVQHGRGFLML